MSGSQLPTEALPDLEQTQAEYDLPVNTETIERVEYESPSHSGPFRGAVDIVVPLGTAILSPTDGRVTRVVDHHTKYGPDQRFAEYLNFIDITNNNGEISQLAHLAPKGAVVKVGDTVQTGQVVATTGNSGWTTEPHLHWIVYVLDQSHPAGFHGRAIRLQPGLSLPSP